MNSFYLTYLVVEYGAFEWIARQNQCFYMNSVSNVCCYSLLLLTNMLMVHVWPSAPLAACRWLQAVRISTCEPLILAICSFGPDNQLFH
jgi:hypothetical protein